MEKASQKSKNTVVIIPAYEPPPEFADYVSSLCEGEYKKIVIIDDGSGEKYATLFAGISEEPRVVLLSYEENRGKGHALKTAFRYCYDNFNNETVFVTADCDGQHLTEDVERVGEAASENPDCLILGSRCFSLDCVPKRSRTGNLFTRRAFSLLYGISVSDTQTGLRGFSYSLLSELMKIKGDRFEYEMNMLISLHKLGFCIIEREITTVYRDSGDGETRLSHFRTFRDSARVLGALFKNLGWYFLSSVVSAVIEVCAFFVLASLSLSLDINSVALKMLIPTVGARLLSSVFNFIFNFKLVFRGKSRRAILRYYTLWLIQLGITYAVACGLNAGLGTLPLSTVEITALITLCKALCDITVAVFSYRVQVRWVFRDDKRQNSFYGVYLKFFRAIYTIFAKKYKSHVTPPKEASVYVSRHLNTLAPVKICQGIGFDLHFFVLHKFFGFKKIYKQYSEYTFTARYNRRGIALFLARIGAFFAALWLAPLIRSVRAIPVYRGGTEAAITFRRAMEYLERGESLAVFPDVDYTSGEGTPSKIYSGFLYLDRLYRRRYGRHLSFIAISVDEKSRTISEVGCVTVGDGKTDEEIALAASKLHDMLMK